jgi:predicted transcriptional regulator of viral defense system
MPNTTQHYRNLFQLASLQDGFFTTKQAISVGYNTNGHPYHVKSGNWIREHRGIYRLANFPTGNRPDLMLWYLWSRNRKEEPQGIYSHESALALHELTDVNPDKLYMTVPVNFRRSTNIPDILVLHYGDITVEEVDDMHGVKVTNAMRTIIDIIREGTLSEDLIKQAIKEATNQGMVTKKTLKKFSKNYKILNDLIDKMEI